MPRQTIAFALVDVFTREPLAGNPLAVVPDARTLDEPVLPRIAREFNQSETTFLYPATRAGADWRLRSFTPAGMEVFGAGQCPRRMVVPDSGGQPAGSCSVPAAATTASPRSTTSSPRSWISSSLGRPVSAP